MAQRWTHQKVRKLQEKQRAAPADSKRVAADKALKAAYKRQENAHTKRGKPAAKFKARKPAIRKPALPVYPVTAWSYSRWNVFAECPRKFQYKFVNKLPDPQSGAAARGEQIHKDAEMYLQLPKSKVPPTLTTISAELADVRKLGAAKGHTLAVEQNWAFRDDWSDTGYFDKDVWLRVKMDAVLVMPKKGIVDIKDWKTGKVRDYSEQLGLYGLTGFMKFTEAKVVTASMVFVDGGDPQAIAYTTKDRDKLKKTWEHRAELMLTEKDYPYRPGRYCNWCPFSKNKGGPCKF